MTELKKQQYSWEDFMKSFDLDLKISAARNDLIYGKSWRVEFREKFKEIYEENEVDDND
jgi:hypothetical protein